MKKLLAPSMMAAAVACAGGAYAGVVEYSGVLTDSPGYHRPSYTNPYTPAFNCSACGFQAERLSVATSGAYTFSIVHDNFPDQVDILYSGGFDPTNPMANYDGPLSYNLYNTGGSKTLSLTAGVQYYWVTSTDYGYVHDNCEETACTFTTKVTGPGAISVPEPSTWAMMLVGFGGMGATLRSRRRLATA
jgi:hypothetical protein